MKKLIASLAAIAALLAPQAARAAAEHYTIDKPHTQIIFFADHVGYVRSMGKFTDYSGTFDFDKVHPEQSKVEITIPADSLEMNDEKWNEHLKGKDFFNVAEFPTITFKSTAIKVTGDKTADITGDLTLLGVTKPVTLHTVFNKEGRFPMGDRYDAGFSATGTLNRSDFGMTYGAAMMADDVRLVIEVEGIRQDPEGKGPVNE